MRRVFLAAIVAALAAGAQAQTELRDLGCAGESSLRSTDESKVTEVIFFNQSPAPIRTYWLDHRGHRIFGSEIRPGEGAGFGGGGRPGHGGGGRLGRRAASGNEQGDQCEGWFH